MKNALDTGIGELSSRYCAARGVNLTVSMIPLPVGVAS